SCRLCRVVRRLIVAIGTRGWEDRRIVCSPQKGCLLRGGAVRSSIPLLQVGGEGSMAVPFLSPGQTDKAVPRMKRRLVRQLRGLGLDSIVEEIAVRSTTYGPAAVEGVRKFQAAKHIHVDGFVGKDTWGALGVHEPVLNPKPVKLPGEKLHGG